MQQIVKQWSCDFLPLHIFVVFYRIETRLKWGKLIHTLGAFIFLFPGTLPSPVIVKKKVKYLSICINPPSRHLSNYCSHHKFKCESFADKMFSSHRLDNDWVGIIQKSPILYRSFKARMFFLLGKLRVTGSWSWERWEVMDGARQRHF